MRIVHAIYSLDPAEGGPPSVASRLAAAQAALGHDVRIVSHRPAQAMERIAASLRGIPDIERVRLEHVPSAIAGWPAPGTAAALRAALEGAQVVHIHGMWRPLLLWAGRAARRYSIPYVVAPHGMLYPWSMARKGWKKKLALLLGFRRMLDGAAFLHVLNGDEERAVAAMGFRAPPRIIANGIFPEEIGSQSAPGTFQQAHPRLGARPYILFLSRLHAGKGLGLLGEAFAMVCAAHGDVQLVVAGPDAGAQADFERQIARAAIAERVHLVGPLYGEDKKAALRDALCFCLPSEHETFSMAITEAMGHGVPVVISDQCHFPEVAAAGAGVVAPRDPRRFAEAILALLADPDRRQWMAEAGRRLVESQFTWPRIAQQAVAAYQEALPR